MIKNKIDKDLNLFLPDEFNFLLLGGNFLFSKRLYEIMKRDYKIKRIDYKHEYKQEYFPCIDNTTFKIYLESYKKIEGLISLYNSDALIFTSEILLFLSNENYLQFVDTLKQIKKLNIKLIFIAISNPLHICKGHDNKNELSDMSSKLWYQDRLKEIKSILDTKKDLIYNFSSYCTYVDSNLQTNPIELLKSKQILNISKQETTSTFFLYLADDVIDDIIINLPNINIITFNKNITPTSLLCIYNNFYKTELYSYINKQTKCSINLIYRKKPHELANNNSIADWRFQLGKSLKKRIPDNIIDELDAIVPIPETGKYYAQGLANSLNKTYLEAFYKQSEMGRSFDINDAQKREQFINSKLGVIPDLITGKTIGIVDEAIFTGQTLKIARNLIKNISIKKIYFFIGSPMCKNKCKLNMQPNRDLLCKNKNINDLISYFDIDGIVFQDLESFKNIVSASGFEHTCCFS